MNRKGKGLFIVFSIFFLMSRWVTGEAIITITKDTISSGSVLSGKVEIMEIGINQFVHRTGTEKLNTGFWVKYNVIDAENIYLSNDRPQAYIAIGETRYARMYPDEKIFLNELGVHTAVSENTFVKDGEGKPQILEDGVYLITHRGYFWIYNMEGKLLGYDKNEAEEKKYQYIYQDKELVKNLTFIICNLQTYQIYFKGFPKIEEVLPGGSIRVGLALRDGDGNEYRVPARGPMKVTIYDQAMKERVIYLDPEYTESISYRAPLSNGRYSGKIPEDIRPKKLVFEYKVSLIDGNGKKQEIPVCKTIE